jgi:hypothetical protein
MLINNVTYYRCLCLLHITDLPGFLLQAYRIVLGIFCLYSCISINWLYLPEFLDIYLIRYVGELSTEPNQVNMFPRSGGGHYGFSGSNYGSSSGGGPFGEGPSGSGGSGPLVGNQSSTDKDEDSNRSRGENRTYFMYQAVDSEKDERAY